MPVVCVFARGWSIVVSAPLRKLLGPPQAELLRIFAGVVASGGGQVFLFDVRRAARLRMRHGVKGGQAEQAPMR